MSSITLEESQDRSEANKPQLTVKELVKALRLCAEKTKNGETCVTGQKDCPFGVTVMDCTERMNLATADALESLAAERDGLRGQLKTAFAENTRLAQQAVPVQCKDCKYFQLHPTSDFADNAGVCTKNSHYCDFSKCEADRFISDFCSYGERKEETNE